MTKGAVGVLLWLYIANLNTASAQPGIYQN